MSDERLDDILQIMFVFESHRDNKLEKRFKTKIVSWRNMKMIPQEYNSPREHEREPALPSYQRQTAPPLG